MHTPGITPDATAIIILSEGVPKYIFPGNTMFIGDVGMPDLTNCNDTKAKEDVCIKMYNSIKKKILTLPGDV